MSLTLSDFQQRFKKIGKLIYAYQQIPSLATSLKSAQIVMVDQPSSTDNDREFDVQAQVVGPLIPPTNRLCSALTDMQCRYVTAARTFLMFVSVDIGSDPTADLSTFSDALFLAMNAAGATLAPAATNPNGISAFLLTNCSLALPEASNPTIPDSYITATVL